MASYNSYYNENYAGMAGSWDGTSSGILYTDRRDFYVSPYEIDTLFPSAAPFTALSSSLGIIEVPDPDFKMFEEDDTFVDQSFFINDGTPDTWSAATVGGDATIEGLDNFKALVIGENLEGLVVEIRHATTNALQSTSLISDYTSSSSITFQHLGNAEASDNGAITITDNAVCTVVGNMRAEGSRAPKGWTSQPRVVWNSAQIQKTPFKITGTLLKAGLRGYPVPELARLRANKAMEHIMQKERSYLLGVRADGNDAPTTLPITDSTSGEPIRSTLGILTALQRYGVSSGTYQNVFNWTAAGYDFDNFLDDMGKMFQYFPAGNRLTLMGGLGLINFFHKLGAGEGMLGSLGSKVNITNLVKDTSVGLVFREFWSPSGILELIYNPLFRGDTYTNYGVVLDRNSVSKVQYRSNEFQAGIQENDADYVVDQYFSDDGIKITNLRKNALIKLV